MTGQPKILISPEEDREMARYLSRTMSISNWLAGFLVNRGIVTPREAGFFLFGDLSDLPCPFDLEGMDKAVKRIKKAIASQEKIMVYGDYDADGITATAILTLFLRKKGGIVFPFLPRREKEGYGLDSDAVTRAAEEGINLLITVDCGSKNPREVSLASSMGMDVVITDHHQIEDLPEACAVVNPHRPDNNYPYPDLAGAGVAFKLCQALEGRVSEYLKGLLPLVAIGTIADLVPLREENRILAREGLKEMEKTNFTGLRALLEKAGISGSINSGNIAFGVAPRLNAAGRLKTARIALELLLTEDPVKAERLSTVLDRLNRRRQGVEEKIVEEARGIFSARKKDLVLVGASEKWNPGVIGIAASKLVEEFSRPVLLIALEGNEGKGSGRSIPGFNLYQALKSVENCLVKYGGHPMAAGFTVEKSSIKELDEKINLFAREKIPEKLLRRRIAVEGPIDLDKADFLLMEDIEKLAPFGIGNPRPLFSNENLTVREKRQVGREGKHLQLKLGSDRATRQAIAFQMGSLFPQLKKGDGYQVVFAPRPNEWNGKKEIQLEVKDIAPSYIREKKQKGGDSRAFFCLVRSGDLARGRGEVLERVENEVRSTGRNAIYIAPTLNRLSQAWQQKPSRIECQLVSGMQQGYKVREALKRIKKKKPCLLFLSFPVFFYFFKRLTTAPLIFSWESPYPDFPPSTYFKFLESNLENWDKLYGMEFPENNWEIPFLPTREIKAGKPGIHFQKKGECRKPPDFSVPVCVFSSRRRKEAEKGSRDRQLVNPFQAVESGNEVLEVGDLPPTGGEFLSFLERWGGNRIIFPDRPETFTPPGRTIGREKLVRIYLEILAGDGVMTIVELGKNLEETPSVLKQALVIFQELGLVELMEKSAEKGFIINKTRGRNVDLFRSLRYNEFVNEKEAHLRWKELLEDSLSRFINVLGGAKNGP